MNQHLDKQFWALMRRLPMRQRRALIHLRCHRRWPNNRHPRRFSDKLNWRILNDRRPLIATVCDKLATKQYVAGAVACPQTHWSGRDLDSLRGVKLPDHWVLKPNHRSGFVHFGSGTPDIDELRGVTRGWLEPGLEAFMGEWGYSQADPVMLVEECLGEPGEAPDDFKFHVFDGEIAFVQHNAARRTVLENRLYSPEWEPLEVTVDYLRMAPVTPRPPGFAEMARIARQIAKPFDFIRVDLYSVNGRIYLGELTPYHGGGHIKYDPPTFDHEVGDHWQLPDDVSGSCRAFQW